MGELEKYNQVIFQAKYQIFLNWVEQTQLFNVIKEETNKKGWNGVMPTIHSRDGSISFSLKAGVIINKAQDLPKEVLFNFFINSPFYNNQNNNNDRENLFIED